MISIEPAVERFQVLRSNYLYKTRARAFSGQSIEELQWAHIELYHLAQAICTRFSPLVQAELDSARREVMEEIINGPRDRGMVMHPTPGCGGRKYVLWSDFQITPEIAFSPSVSFRFVSKRASMRLIRAHKRQISEVIRIVREML